MFNSSRAIENSTKIQNLLRKLVKFFNDSADCISLRLKIEDLLAFNKNAVIWEPLYSYTKTSAHITAKLNSLLLGIMFLPDSDVKRKLNMLLSDEFRRELILFIHVKKTVVFSLS
ncbi:hypothetical protein DK846_13825 [Methanospirillum lacunae]|uniref:Uncharacterized protein n=1 Tax=Methanospirillum lacunae TaxID=668570 RepID=A0A2V2MR28_9EURY|nr:hypothetical protein DK846_13825 [Methanospirillum lacunae]